jgi:alpha-D-xyloside xylohydrolase
LEAGEHTVLINGDKNDLPSLYLRLTSDQTVFQSPVSDGIDYVVFAGKADEAIASYRRLSGAAPLMPIWALGYIHCRERFRSQNEVLENANEFRNRKLPMDLIVQDWQYWGKYGWNAMKFDEKDYPNPAKLVDSLHAMNARLMVSVWSKLDPKCEVGKEMTAKQFYIPNTQWIDFFNPEAAACYWKNFSSRLLMPYKIDAWWLDATEPENDDLVGRKVINGTMPGEKLRNIYPLYVTKTVYEGSRKDVPEKRVCILTRSAFSGQQRYASATWSGDIGNTWETFRRQIPAGLNYVITGLPYWTTDCGGFFRPAKQYTDTAYHERFLRWFQYATFCPLQRVHGYVTNAEFWRFGPKVEREALRYLNLRYRLLPYIYSQAAEVTFSGSTLMRPLVMDFAADNKALDQKYEYMFGPSILVAPVLQPNVKSWEVYLPENKAGWYDFWTGDKVPGGQTISTEATIDKIPLFVKAGSIIPFGSEKQYSTQRLDELTELRIYSGADASFRLYEDDGVSYNYEKGEKAIVDINWNEEKQALTIGKRSGSFSGMKKEKVFKIVWVAKNKGVGIEPFSNAKKLIYNGNSICLKRK